MSDAPERIYLQWYGDSDSDEPGEVYVDEVTWCESHMFDGDIEYRRVREAQGVTMEQSTVLKGFAIVIADRGFVYVGKFEHDGTWCVIRDAQNIRRWGTTRGLGELAATGPTPDTTLDPYGTVRVPASSVIGIIESEASLWKS